MNDLEIRPMTVDDINMVCEIEHHSFSVPWTKDSFYREIVTNNFAIYHVAVHDQKVVGYCGMWLVLDETQITNIAVLPEYRGKGFGERLLLHAMETAKSKGGSIMTLEVRVSNRPAQGLYEKLGFAPGGIRKNYYSDNQEDALVMWVNL
ncbi:ribosomal-protein-alanine N-acetyltransferase [Bacillus ectoiniformans]|uniref:ribosomal protein S18-alanine N-acetyltransferase n=1 Tax=Bacillus ectoiniformans TaxID=1494429 RepID=UPI00195C464B|nr:ribosomal protein S18-alanine N-acetyltransferase [Bacillus ectoiniformans]MBM7650519.1 ribosomal-protein-alanine N-acetyltransferase [Bacillus ectoiniformans]